VSEDDADREEAEYRQLSTERLTIKLHAFYEKLGCNEFLLQVGSIINDPCPVGFVILRNKTTQEEMGQFGAILSCRSRSLGFDGGGNGTIEVLTIERLSLGGQPQCKEYEDRNRD
jgi:hypothetical protein